MSIHLAADPLGRAASVPGRRRSGTVWTAVNWLLALTVSGALGWAVWQETQCSCVQSLLVSKFARQLSFAPAAGPSPAPRFPESGPYDGRLGYVALPSMVRNLDRHDFRVIRQARMSSALTQFIDNGGYAIYPEKMQAGLTLFDRSAAPLFEARYPERVYDGFADIPPAVARTLLFVEDRHLLDDEWPQRNPAIDWPRFAIAAVGQIAGAFDPALKQGGASTLATQIEKFRHSPDGQTGNAGDKLRQMMTATVRAYAGGPDTTAWRQQLVASYLNATPLGSRPGYGEVIGLGDGLWVWYGSDFRRANAILKMPSSEPAILTEKARYYRQVLSLLLAQRRPAAYLNDLPALEALTDIYLPLLEQAGAIDPRLRDAALAQRLRFTPKAPSPATTSFVARKAVNAIRTELLTKLRAGSLYSLDRLDATAHTTIDAGAQRRVAAVLARLGEPEQVQALGLTGHRLLGDEDPSHVNYSVVLYERGKDRNYLRVHADNLDEPFDINSGAKLILGSTAKLRTLVSYLNVIATLHKRLATLSDSALRARAAEAADPLTRWAAGWLAGAQDRSLSTLLDAAMQRRYSANPHETFFTGGGAHTFHNFQRSEDGTAPAVIDAFENSVNLVFIRMMRDIVRYHVAALEDGAGDNVLSDKDHPAREAYLRRFADGEGRAYLNRFYGEYAELAPDEVLAKIAARTSPIPARLATVYRSVRPQAEPAAFRDWIRGRLSRLPLKEAEIARLYDQYAADRWSLQDRGYIAGIHPLELWLAGYLHGHPEATRSQVMEASAQARQDAYAWLLKTRNQRKQDVRIRILLEQEAFSRIHQEWQSLGYPFGSLVPSLATAIGSSGDRPEALATLMGIVLNDGVRLPGARIERVHFAADTPYETELALQPDPPARVLAPEVAARVRLALMRVAEQGTAQRLRGAYRAADGGALPVGGKTGTGDNRFERYGANKRLIESRVVDRTATFVFFLGDRFFGTVTAYVRGEQAAHSKFTSALAVQLLKALAPEIEPLLREQPPGERPAASATKQTAEGTASDRMER